MNRKTIGVLGATGHVGREAANTLINFTDTPIILGSRNREKLHKTFPETDPETSFLQVDIYDKEALDRFCDACDIVVNCAGPSKKITDRVASAALRRNVHYVDVSGDETLYDAIMKENREIRDKGLSFLISAGTYPGLSEIFPAYIAGNYFDDVQRLELFFTGNGGFSLNAAYDIVCSIAEDNGAGMTYCESGRTRKITGEFQRSLSLPHPAGKRDAYPIINEEFRRMAELHGIKSAYFYNTYQDKSVLSKFVMIKALEQYKTEEQKRKSAEVLTKEYGVGESAPDDFTMFHIIAAGWKDGKPAQLASNMLYQNNWNALSGVVAANAARLLLEKDAVRSGCFFVAEGTDVTRIIRLLSKQNVSIRNSALPL